jgi:hypothetical protein
MGRRTKGICFVQATHRGKRNGVQGGDVIEHYTGLTAKKRKIVMARLAKAGVKSLE